MGGIIMYCYLCKYEYEIDIDLIMKCSGRKPLLCSTCGETLATQAGIRFLKKYLKEELTGVSR